MTRQQIIHSHIREDSYFRTLAGYLARLAREKAPADIGPDPGHPDWLSALDFRQITDTGQVVLFDLSSQRRPGAGIRQLADAIVSNLLAGARQRAPESDLFFLYIDGLLAGSHDLTYILEQGYKFSLDLILAHESLAQLKEAGEDVYRAVMTNAPTKYVFNFDQLSPEDQEILAACDIKRRRW